MSSTPRRFDPGSAFKDGMLYLFSDDSALVVRAWPDPRAWRLALEGTWKGARPIGLDLAAPDKVRSSSSRRLRCQAQAFSVIPASQRRAAARFGVRAWALHSLFTRVPGALQLAERCPALAAGLAFATCLRPPVQQPLRSARALLRRPGPHSAQQVADWLGFEPSRALVRVLGKLEPGSCGVQNLRAIGRAMANPRIRKFLLHTPRLHQPLLRLLAVVTGPDWDTTVGNAVLVALASRPPQRAWPLVARIEYLQRSWSELFPQRRLPELVAVRQVNRLHAELMNELSSPEFLRSLARALGGFPLPPLNGGLIGGVRISPLRSVDDLLAEGEAMQHCIGSRRYVEDCVRGRGFGYRVGVEAPGLRGHEGLQATAWISPTAERRWQLGELRSVGNVAPLPLLNQAVERWLQDQNEPLSLPAPEIPEAARGRTLRVVRCRRRPACTRRGARAPRPSAQGQQLQLGFMVPF